MTKHLWKGNLETADICGYIYIMYIDFIGTYIYDYIYSSFCYKIFKSRNGKERMNPGNLEKKTSSREINLPEKDKGKTESKTTSGF